MSTRQEDLDAVEICNAVMFTIVFFGLLFYMDWLSGSTGEYGLYTRDISRLRMNGQEYEAERLEHYLRTAK